MKSKFLKRLWCFLTCGCDMRPKNFITSEQFKEFFYKAVSYEEIANFLKTEPYLECKKCGRVVK